MEIITTHNKWEAFKAFTNTWLRDQTLYCNNCGENYEPTDFPCCENPQVGRNKDHCVGLIKQNNEMRKSRNNEFASIDNNTIRWGISLPPRLYQDANNYFRKLYHEKLFNDQAELREFMKAFPQFCIPETI